MSVPYGFDDGIVFRPALYPNLGLRFTFHCIGITTGLQSNSEIDENLT